MKKPNRNKGVRPRANAFDEASWKVYEYYKWLESSNRLTREECSTLTNLIKEDEIEAISFGYSGEVA